MKEYTHFIPILILLSAIFIAGCSAEFWGGAGTGALGAGAGYEISAKKQMDQINDDLKAGRITQEEYDIRKDQIERGSLTR